LSCSEEAEISEGVAIVDEMVTELSLELVDDEGSTLEGLTTCWALKVPPTGGIEGVKLDATIAAADLNILKSWVYTITSGSQGTYDSIKRKKHSCLTKVFMGTIKISRGVVCHIYYETSARSRSRPGTYLRLV